MARCAKAPRTCSPPSPHSHTCYFTLRTCSPADEFYVARCLTLAQPKRRGARSRRNLVALPLKGALPGVAVGKPCRMPYAAPRRRAPAGGGSV